MAIFGALSSGRSGLIVTGAGLSVIGNNIANGSTVGFKGSRTEFAEEVFWPLAYKARALVAGFNLPFDLSRLALECGAARGSFRGGFSFILSGRREGRGQRLRPAPYRPRIVVRHLDSKKSFIKFNRPAKIDRDDQRPAKGAPRPTCPA